MELEDEIVPLDQESQQILVHVLTSTAVNKLKLHPNSTILELKEKMSQILQLPPSKAIRLIFRGRVLDDQHTLSRCGIRNNSFVHCNVSDRIPQDVRRQMQQASQNNQEQTTQFRGFDRLREYGFAETDIEQFRTQFHLHRLINNGFLNTNMNLEYLRNIEEEWINSEINNASNNNNNNDISVSQNTRGDTVVHLGENPQTAQEEEHNTYGTYEDLAKGIAMGFFLNLIMLLWMSETSLSSRTRAGIIIGLIASISLGVLKMIVF